MNNEVLIVGYGRLGRTLAGIMKEWRSISVLEQAHNNQKLARDDGFELVGEDQQGNFKTVIISVPINQFESVVKEIAPKLAAGALLVDTCSVKIYPAKVMTELAPKNVQLLATHPLFGPDSVKLGLKGLGLTLCPLRIDDDELNEWRHFWRGLGVKVIEITPDEHDRASAYTLGLTHVIGRVLGELELKREEIATAGFNALLEVIEQTGHDSWQLFCDMQHYNPYSVEMRDKLTLALDDVKQKLDQAIN
jgi:prephenate dehydrogenase